MSYFIMGQWVTGCDPWPTWPIQKWWPIWPMNHDPLTHFHLCTGRCWLSVANFISNLVQISEIAVELWRFSFFKMAASRHLWFCSRSKLVLRHVADVHRAKCITVSQLATELLRFVEKNGGVRHFEFVFGNFGPPAKSNYGPEVSQQIWC